MADKSGELLDYLERKRKLGIGADPAVMRKYSDSERKSALKMQEDNMVKEGIVKKKAYPPDTDADADIKKSQSQLRQKFMGQKGYK
jgi:hypothetical protein